MTRYAVLALLIAACGSKAESADDIVDAWKAAGMATTVFEARDGADLGGGRCEAGRVDGLHVIVCRYDEAEAAKAATSAGLKVVGDATGAALPADRLLLVVADRDRVDPSGRAIHKLTTTFMESAGAAPKSGAGLLGQGS